MSSDSKEALAARARQMRAEGATYGQIKKALGLGSSTVARLLGTAGTGKPRRRLSDEQRARARKLRENGWSVPDISKELGIAKSTAFQLTQGIAYEVSADEVERRRGWARGYWNQQNALRDAARQEAHLAAMNEVAGLTQRELLLVGAALYWAEGAKAKPWRQDERLQFINSDPGSSGCSWHGSMPLASTEAGSGCGCPSMNLLTLPAPRDTGQTLPESILHTLGGRRSSATSRQQYESTQAAPIMAA